MTEEIAGLGLWLDTAAKQTLAWGFLGRASVAEVGFVAAADSTQGETRRGISSRCLTEETYLLRRIGRHLGSFFRDLRETRRLGCRDAAEVLIEWVGRLRST